MHVGRNTLVEKINKARKSRKQTVAHRWQFFKSILIAMGKMKNRVNVRKLSASLWALPMEPFYKKVSTFYPHAHIYRGTNHLNSLLCVDPLMKFTLKFHLSRASLDLKAAAPPSPCYYSQELETEIKYGLISPCNTAEKQQPWAPIGKTLISLSFSAVRWPVLVDGGFLYRP